MEKITETNDLLNGNLREIIKKKFAIASDFWRTGPEWCEEFGLESTKLVDDLVNEIVKFQEPHISILEPGSEAAILFEAAKPLMKLLNDNYHPHCTIIVNHGNVQVYEGICSTGFTNEFMND
jgi:hypothetical protein